MRQVPIRVDDDTKVTEKLFVMVPMSRRTTGVIYLCIEKRLENTHTDWSKLVSVTTDGVVRLQ